MKLPPISSKMTPVIAERDLMLVAGGRRRRVRIVIGRPVQDVETAGGLDWRCPTTVAGAGRTRSGRGLGVDSLQALVDALKQLELEMRELERRTSGRLEWLGLQSHGLPKVRTAESELIRKSMMKPRAAAAVTARQRGHEPHG